MYKNENAFASFFLILKNIVYLFKSWVRKDNESMLHCTCFLSNGSSN